MNQSLVMIPASVQQPTGSGRSPESRSARNASSGRSRTRTRGVYHLSITEDAVTKKCVSSFDETQRRSVEESIVRQTRAEDKRRDHRSLARESARAPDQLEDDMRINQITDVAGKTPNVENELNLWKEKGRSIRRLSQNTCPNSLSSDCSQEVDESDEVDMHVRKIERLGGLLPFTTTTNHAAHLSFGRSPESGEAVCNSRGERNGSISSQGNQFSQPSRSYDATLLHRMEDGAMRRNPISKGNPTAQGRNESEFHAQSWRASSRSNIKPWLDQAEDEVRRKYGAVSVSKGMVPLRSSDGASFRRMEFGVSSSEEEFSLPPHEVRAFAHQLLDQLSNMEDRVLVKGNASIADKTRVLQARGERSPIASNIPSPPVFRRETPLRTITARVTKEISRVEPGMLLPGAYRAGNWETECDEDDCSMTYSEMLMHLSESEREREEERDIQMARNQLLSSQSLQLSQESRNESVSHELGRERSLFMDDQHRQEQVQAQIETTKGRSAAYRRGIICAIFVLVIGAIVGLVFGLIRRNDFDASEPQVNGDLYRCLYDLNLSEQCNANGRLSNVPNLCL